MPGYFVKTRGILRTSQILPANSTFKNWECLRSETDRTKHLLQHFCLATKVQNTVYLTVWRAWGVQLQRSLAGVRPITVCCLMVS